MLPPVLDYLDRRGEISVAADEDSCIVGIFIGQPDHIHSEPDIHTFLHTVVSLLLDAPEDKAKIINSLKPLKEFLIAFAGPLASIAIGIISGIAWWFIHEISLPLASIFRYLGIINIALAVFNLMPGFPLDGGRILRATIW